MGLVLILGDQLSLDLASLRAADKEHDIIVMAEVASEATYVRHHPKKIAFIFSSMRKFAAALKTDGWKDLYSQLDDTQNAVSFPAVLLLRAQESGA